MDDTTSCPRLDPRLGPRALAVALVHVLTTRGHAACMYERVAVAAIRAVVSMRSDVQRMQSSLEVAIDLIERAEGRWNTYAATWLSDGEKRRRNAWN